VLDELLSGLNIGMTYENLDHNKLSLVNFYDMNNFVLNFEIMIKQVGKFLRPYIEKLSEFLIVGIIKLCKLFLAKVTDDEQVHYSAVKQAKETLRLCL
jgi:hypothetical protein